MLKKKSKNHAYFSAFSKRIISNTQEKLPKEFKASFKLPLMQTYSLELEGIFWEPTKNIALLSRLSFSEEKKVTIIFLFSAISVSITQEDLEDLEKKKEKIEWQRRKLGIPI